MPAHFVPICTGYPFARDTEEPFAIRLLGGELSDTHATVGTEPPIARNRLNTSPHGGQHVFAEAFGLYAKLHGGNLTLA